MIFSVVSNAINSVTARLHRANRPALKFALVYAAIVLALTLGTQLTLIHGFHVNRFVAWVVACAIYFGLFCDWTLGHALRLWARIFWR